MSQAIKSFVMEFDKLRKILKPNKKHIPKQKKCPTKKNVSQIKIPRKKYLITKFISKLFSSSFNTNFK